MALPPDVRLSLAYQRRYNQLRLRTGAVVGALWDRYADLDDAAADEFSERAAATVGAAQARTTALVNGYLTAAVAITSGAPLETDDATPSPRPADPLEVYQRGIVTARAAVSDGIPYLDAMRAGRARSVNSAETDIALAQRDVMSRAVGGTRIVGYRRTLTGDSCPLCRIASTQRYTRSSLMPLHGHCDCGVAPIIGEHDPGEVINKPLLAELKQQGEIDRITQRRALPKARTALENAERRVEDLRREITSGRLDQERETRYERRLDKWQQTVEKRKAKVEQLSKPPRQPQIQVHDHGELGPILTEARHDFTGPGDIAA